MNDENNNSEIDPRTLVCGINRISDGDLS